MNHKINSRGLRLLGLVLSFALSASAFAQSASSSYKTVMDKPHGNVPGKVGADLGEQFNMYTGAIEFQHVDLTVPGSERLPIVISRRLALGEKNYSRPINRFADWQLEVPRIWATVPPPRDWANSVNGVPAPVYPQPGTKSPTGLPAWLWQAGWQTNNCSTGLPQLATSRYGEVVGEASGYFLAIPGSSDEIILTRAYQDYYYQGGIYPVATVPGSSPLLTKSNWKFSCGNDLKTAQGLTIGESFIATSPEGTTYYFNLLIGEDDHADPLIDETGNPIVINRYSVVATKAQDIYGNTVNYNYDTAGRLTSISASDGRLVQIAYGSTDSNYISAISSGGRTWTYNYDNHAHDSGLKFLRTVVRPDGSTWLYDMDDLSKPWISPYPPSDPCVPLFGTSSGTITTPFGMKANYVAKGICNGVAEYGRSDYTPRFSSFALQSKTYSGGGIPSTSWTFSYNNPPGWSDVVSGQGATTKSLTINNPDGTASKITTDMSRFYSEGSILSEELYSASGTLLRKVANTYSKGQFYGLSSSGGGNGEAASYKSNLTRRDVTQDGTTYTTTWSQFDGFDMPGQIVESNSAGGPAKTTTLAYYTDLNKWIIDKPLAMSVNGTETMRMAYGTKGEITSVTAFGLPKAYMSYDALGQLATMSDPLGDVTTYSNYYRGTARTVRLPDATQMTTAVNDFGELTSMSNALGATWTMGRDGLGRITSMYFPSADTVAWAPEAMTYTQLTAAELGMPIGSWRARKIVGNHQQTMYFDAELRPVLIEDKDNTTGASIYQRMRYDYADRMVFSSYKSTDPNVSAGTKITYDALGRMIGMQTTDGTVLQSVAYLSGNRVQVTDGTGAVTTTTYQAFGKPNMDRPILIAAPEGQTTQIVRDVFGKILSATQGTITQTWVYDSYQRLCKKVEPEAGQTVMAYDVADRVIWSAKGVSGDPLVCSNGTAPSNAVTMTYDAMNRPVRAHYPDTTGDVTMAYDAAGRVISAINPTASWAYTYNKRGLQESAQASVDGHLYTVGRRYNTLGDLAAQIFPDGLRTDLYADAFGRPTQLGGYATGIQYHPNGVIRGYNAANGTNYNATLNSRQLPETISVRGPAGLLQSLTYGYNAANDVTWILDGVDGSDTVNNLTYDGLHRLKSANGLWGSYNYNYDVLNNLTARTGTNPQSYSYNALNRLASVVFSGAAPAPLPSGGSATTPATFSYYYDTQGRTIYDGLRSYTWNIADELTSITGIATYAYDAHGKRIKSTKADGTVEYAIYDGETLVYADRPAGNQHWSYLQLGGKPFVKVQNGVATYLHTDLLGSPRLATNAGASTVWREHYGPYGEKLNGVNDKIGYTGHAYDAESHLTYAQARFYDPAVGRFISTDPIGFSGTDAFNFNRYTYGNNSPFVYSDPTGMCSSFDGPSSVFCEGQGLYSMDEAGAEGGIGYVTGRQIDRSDSDPGLGFFDDSGVLAISVGGGEPGRIGQLGVDQVIQRYVSSGYTLAGTEVNASLPGIPYTRRYDFVVNSLETGAFIGVEVKASEIGIFRLDRKQVAFDAAVLSTRGGAVTNRGFSITGVRYDGIDLAGRVNARFQMGYLYRLLQAAGIAPSITRGPP